MLMPSASAPGVNTAPCGAACFCDVRQGYLRSRGVDALDPRLDCLLLFLRYRLAAERRLDLPDWSRGSRLSCRIGNEGRRGQDRDEQGERFHAVIPPARSLESSSRAL